MIILESHSEAADRTSRRARDLIRPITAASIRVGRSRGPAVHPHSIGGSVVVVLDGKAVKGNPARAMGPFAPVTIKAVVRPNNLAIGALHLHSIQTRPRAPVAAGIKPLLHLNSKLASSAQAPHSPASLRVFTLWRRLQVHRDEAAFWQWLRHGSQQQSDYHRATR